jgi:hypothetical protein
MLQRYLDMAAADKNRYAAEHKSVYGIEAGKWESEASKINRQTKKPAKARVAAAAKEG